MIDIEDLARRLVKHVAACPSSALVCQVRVAVESWFRVELAYLLYTTEEGLEAVSFDYEYPFGRAKADLSVRLTQEEIVFELKSFVCGADANKISEFPKQLIRLQRLVQRGQVRQAVALATFIGYTENRINTLLDRFFPPTWQRTLPRRFVESGSLEFVLAASS